VRDPHGWAKYLTETIDLFGGEVEVVFASHHWPTWDNQRVVDFLSTQRDLYAYLAARHSHPPREGPVTEDARDAGPSGRPNGIRGSGVPPDGTPSRDS
jgi:alkyl sulfatase BDS1-like metallo-beta-lactamase superfamily hydrolase